MIDIEEVRRIAALSQLTLDESELAQTKKELAALLRMIDRLTRIGLPDGANVSSDPVDAEALCADVAAESMPRETLLAQAPESEDGAFRVPRSDA